MIRVGNGIQIIISFSRKRVSEIGVKEACQWMINESFYFHVNRQVTLFYVRVNQTFCLFSFFNIFSPIHFFRFCQFLRLGKKFKTEAIDCLNKKFRFPFFSKYSIFENGHLSRGFFLFFPWFIQWMRWLCYANGCFEICSVISSKSFLETNI